MQSQSLTQAGSRISATHSLHTSFKGIACHHLYGHHSDATNPVFAFPQGNYINYGFPISEQKDLHSNNHGWMKAQDIKLNGQFTNLSQQLL